MAKLRFDLMTRNLANLSRVTGEEKRTRGGILRRVLLAFCAVVAFAQPGPARGADTRVLRIGTSGDYAPFSELIEEAPGYRGFDVSVAEAFARDRGYQIEWVKFRWPELAANLRSGWFDLAMSGVTVRFDRSVAGRFSVPVMTSGAVLLYSLAPAFKPEATLTVAERFAWFNRPGVRIAVNRGGHLERATRAAFGHAAIRAIPDNKAVRQALVDRSVDAIVTDTLEAPGWRAGLEGVAVLGPWTRDRKAYWVAPGHDALSRELDRWLIAQELRGELAQLRRSAFGQADYEQTALPLAALLAASDERLALMPWVADSKRRGGVAVEDRGQENRVLEAGRRRVRAAAERAGVAPPAAVAVTAFYRAQIEAAKAIQYRTLKGEMRHPAEVKDLQEILRPALIRIGDRMAQLIVAYHQQAVVPDLDLKGEVERALRARKLDGKRLDEIFRTIRDLAAAGTQSNRPRNRAVSGAVRSADVQTQE